ncbi:MAG: metallophosphoesterase family protein [Eubacteriales bacterium]|nr:metallophosphoesterase family protein [Eubacteriales bacterium]
MKEQRTLILTDIHGCFDECAALLDRMEFDADADRLINLGDLVDRGPKIYETFTFLKDLKEKMGDRCILIRGNHEQMMLDAAREGNTARDLWYYNSGEKTVFSFLHNKHRYQEYLSWFEEMPLYYETDLFTCVHASLSDPDPAKNEPQTLIWGRDTDYNGKTVMTGHTPYRAPIIFQGEYYGRIQEDVWTYMPETGMIALDTGCVFGNRLTGMIVREDGTFKVTSVASGVGK